MHGTTIVQNKIIRIICPCHFFCPANIYRPSLGKVGEVGLNQNRLSGSIFISEEKEKPHSLRIVCTTTC